MRCTTAWSTGSSATRPCRRLSWPTPWRTAGCARRTTPAATRRSTTCSGCRAGARARRRPARRRISRTCCVSRCRRCAIRAPRSISAGCRPSFTSRCGICRPPARRRRRPCRRRASRLKSCARTWRPPAIRPAPRRRRRGIARPPTWSCCSFSGSHTTSCATRSVCRAPRRRRGSFSRRGSASGRPPTGRSSMTCSAICRPRRPPHTVSAKSGCRECSGCGARSRIRSRRTNSRRARGRFAAAC